MDLRREDRFKLKSRGRYRRGHGRAYHIFFEDISEFGCRFHDLSGRLESGDSLTIKVGEIGPIDACVKWCEQRKVGVEFERPLHPAILEFINQTNPGVNKSFAK